LIDNSHFRPSPGRSILVTADDVVRRILRQELPVRPHEIEELIDDEPEFSDEEEDLTERELSYAIVFNGVNTLRKTVYFRPSIDFAADDFMHKNQPCAITDQPSEAEKLPNIDVMTELR
jgi:hypothetical protein